MNRYTLPLLCALATLSAFANPCFAQNGGAPPDPAAPPPQTYNTPPGYGQQQQPPPQQPYGQQQQPYGQQQPQQTYPPPQPQQPYAPPTTSQPVYAPPGQLYAPGPGRLVRERYRAGDPVPPGARVFGRRKTGLIISGAILFGVTYLLSGALVVAVDRDLGGDVDYMPVVPVFGPLISSGSDNGSYEGFTGLALMSMMAQAAGLTMFALGLVRRQYIEYYVATGGGREIRIRPDFAMTRGGSTVGATLTF